MPRPDSLSCAGVTSVQGRGQAKDVTVSTRLRETREVYLRYSAPPVIFSFYRQIQTRLLQDCQRSSAQSLSAAYSHSIPLSTLASLLRN